MLNPRIYRAAFVPVVFALVIAAFSLRDQPGPLQSPLAPDAWNARGAYRDLGLLATAAPERKPGSPGDRAVARIVARRLHSYGFTVRTREEQGRTADGTRTLRTVIAERVGLADGAIVVVAHRDALGHGAEAELSGTEGLLEIGRVLGQRTLRRSIVLISASGGPAGAAAAARAVDRPTDAVLALGDLAGPGREEPKVVQWASSDDRAPSRLRRTVENALRTEVGAKPFETGAGAQVARLALPLTMSDQGPFGARGYPAVTLSSSGERPPPADESVSLEGLTAYGRAALRTVTALDAGPAVGTAGGFLLVHDKEVPIWAVALLVAALMFPALVAIVDAFARARRRRRPVGMWLLWTGASILPFALCAGYVLLLRVTGLLHAAPPGPMPAGAVPLTGGGIAALAGVVPVFALGWFLLRPLLLRLLGVRGRREDAGAASAVLLTFGALCVVVWLANPFAALLLLPALHIWLLVLGPEVRPRAKLAVPLVLAGLLPLLLVALYYALVFHYGLVDVLWNGLLLIAGGGVGAATVFAGCVLLGCAAGAVAIARSRRVTVEAPAAAGPVTIRGPRSYAGPGSLGGTESALRR